MNEGLGLVCVSLARQTPLDGASERAVMRGDVVEHPQVDRPRRFGQRAAFPIKIRRWDSGSVTNSTPAAIRNSSLIPGRLKVIFVRDRLV